MKLILQLFLLLLFASCFFGCGEDIDHTDCTEICEAYEEGPFNNMGDCVSLCTTCFNPSESAGNTAVCFCNYIEALLNESGEDWDDVGVKNKGQCIKLVKEEFNND